MRCGQFLICRYGARRTGIGRGAANSPLTLALSRRGEGTSQGVLREPQDRLADASAVVRCCLFVCGREYPGVGSEGGDERDQPDHGISRGVPAVSDRWHGH